MKLYKCEVGMLATNCYLAVNEDNKQGVIVDPGADCDSIMELVEHAGVEKVVLLYLGVQNIHTGPTLPAFFTPDILKVLKEKFGIGTISTVENDIAALINN